MCLTSWVINRAFYSPQWTRQYRRIPLLHLPCRGGEKRGGRRVLRGDIHLLVHRIADDRTGHAVAAAAATAQFRTDNGDDLDALLAQQGVRVRVAVVGVHHSRRGADEVGAAVPLRALTRVGGPAGLDHAHLFYSKRVCPSIHEGLLVLTQLESARVVPRPV